MNLESCMKKKVYAVPSTATVREAIQLLVSHHIGLLPVLDAQQRPLGVIGLRDLLNLALPAAILFIEDLDFIEDFGAIESFQPAEEVLAQPIQNIMRPVTAVRSDSGLTRAYVFMLQQDLHDLPVVDEAGRLIGIASRVDIGTSILSKWT